MDFTHHLIVRLERWVINLRRRDTGNVHCDWRRDDPRQAATSQIDPLNFVEVLICVDRCELQNLIELAR